MLLSPRISRIAPSPTLVMAAKAREMKSQGIDVLSMSLGEPDFPTPPHVKQAVKEAVDADFSHYGPVPGIPELRSAAATYMGHGYKAEDIIVSVGAKQAVCNAIETLIGPCDEVLLPTPCWVSYVEMVKIAEGTPVMLPTKMDERFILTPEALEAAITPRTRLILLCSPNNPTGAVYTAEEIHRLAEVLLRHPNIAVLADEIYSEISYTGKAASWMEEQALHDRLIVVNGVSKAFAMTGYRIGWLACKNTDFIKACTRLQGQQITCATMVAQYAAAKALSGDMTTVRQMIDSFRKRRDLILALAQDIQGFKVCRPDGAFYLFPNVTALFGAMAPSDSNYAQQRGTQRLSNADDLIEYLLLDGHIACVSGSAFGEPSCIRISYAASEEQITEAMRRIKLAIDKLIFHP